MSNVAGGTNQLPERRPLENKPLVEAIFELRWRLISHQAPGIAADPGFRIFLGKYYDRVKRDYPVVVDLPSSAVPEEITPHQVRHQFRKAKDDWPLTQVGPGIMTVNETSGYLWDSFHPRLLSAIEAVYHSYPSEIAPFQPISGALKYIDAIEYNPVDSQLPVLAFLRSHLHTGIEIEPLLFDTPAERESPLGLNLSIAYRLTKPLAVAQLMIAMGTREGKPSLIMETTVTSLDNAVPRDPRDWRQWLIEAHAISDRWFFALVRGQLLKEFERKHDTSNIKV